MYGRLLLERLISFFVGVAVVILGLRIFFRLFDANSSAGFVEWVYDTSDVLMAPFRGIFPPVTIEPGVVFDVAALFSIIMYVLIGFLLLSLVGFAGGYARDDDRPVKKSRRQ